MAIPTEKQKLARKRNWDKRLISGSRSRLMNIAFGESVSADEARILRMVCAELNGILINWKPTLWEKD